MAAQSFLFTVEFRRKMAELPLAQRQEWLASLIKRMRDEASTVRPLLAQELREVARGCRIELVESIKRHLGPFDPKLLQAVLEVPRERFVRPQDLELCGEDTPLPLDDQGLATISAPHAYLLSYRLLGLRAGDTLVELGTGSGYGAALAAFVVGPDGRVLTFEIDPRLAAWAKRTLSTEPNVTILEADATTSAPAWSGATKVAVTFAVEEIPPAWLEALPEAGMLVAPVGGRDADQRLVLAVKRRGILQTTDHGAVRYVKNRSRR